jgi:hypothetical protein
MTSITPASLPAVGSVAVGALRTADAAMAAPPTPGSVAVGRWPLTYGGGVRICVRAGHSLSACRCRVHQSHSVVSHLSA